MEYPKKEIEIARAYYRDRLLKGEYKLIETDTHYAAIEIDDEAFKVWLYNGRDHTAFYNPCLGSWLSNSWSNGERKAIYDRLVKSDPKRVERIKLEAQITELEKQMEEL